MDTPIYYKPYNCVLDARGFGGMSKQEYIHDCENHISMLDSRHHEKNSFVDAHLDWWFNKKVLDKNTKI